LAVVGHVERAWSYSFEGAEDQPQVGVFAAALGQLLRGLPVGAAMEWFNQRYAALAATLTGKVMRYVLADIPIPAKVWDEMAPVWTEHNDARSYVVLGDPAVRLTR
ncbi:MAG: hypothetical protein L0Z53_12290, partial [Acidobacteriales bacterium]|nr:hypothetical protein [Terriglobales bacterium]